MCIRLGGCPPPRIFVVSGRIAMKVWTGVNNRSVTSNTEIDFQKSDGVIDNDVTMLKLLSLFRKIQQKDT